MSEFLDNQVAGLIAAAVSILLLMYILRRRSHPIVKKLLRGAIAGLFTSAILHYILHLSWEWVAIISTGMFLLTAFKTKIKL